MPQPRNLTRAICVFVPLIAIGYAASGDRSKPTSIKTAAAAPAVEQPAAKVDEPKPAPKVAERKSEPKRDEPPPPPPTPKRGEAVSKEFFEWFSAQMAYDCNQAIKRQVRYNIRSPGLLWGENTADSAFFLLRMSRYSKQVAPDNTIMLVGDEAEAQNGFGNWLRITYVCKVDVSTNTVKHATFSSGRLQ